jgi:glutamine synthetase
MDKDSVIKAVKDDDVKFIRLWFTDVVGQLKSFAITATEIETALNNGMGFDGSSITGYQDIEESDMIAMPDPSTFKILPWRGEEHKVGRMICDVLNPDGTPYEGDPRYQLKRALKRAEDMGFDHFYVGPELEFFYFKNSEGTEVLDKGGYFDLTPLDVASDLRRDTVMALEEMGIDVEYSHHEVGPSQHEIDIRYGDALKIADDAMTYRLVVKEIAEMYGVYATFMPKPLFGENGSGMHTHQSLFKGNDNAFFDGSDEYFLSDNAKSYIAGLLKHASEISCVFAQWVNSYKRLVPGYEAPVYKAWSRRNRSALIRVPMYHPGQEKATRCEFRSPDPACNPYLTFAVMLQAGLEGIEKGYKLENPMEMNLYDLNDAERAELGVDTLPESLGDALKYAGGSELLKKAPGDHIYTRFLELKKKEWDEYRVQLSPWEMDKYLSIL